MLTSVYIKGKMKKLKKLLWRNAIENNDLIYNKKKIHHGY